MRLFLFSLLTLTLIASCSSEEQTSDDQQLEKIDNSFAGESFMENKCYSCHSPKVAKEYVLAPPMIAIKVAYNQSYKNEEEFVKAFKQFLSKPTNDKAIMKEAVEKHGLMPYQGSSEEEITMIARYIYNNEISKPEWWNNEEKSADKELNFAEIGLKHALTTKKALGKTLMTSIEQKGTEGALEFCNKRAIPITDSMSALYNAKIKRVSDKPRNPNNLANQEELVQIDFFKSQIKAKEEIEPVTVEKENSVQFYYPIVTNDMCLQCHGTKNKELKKTTLNKIAKFYPSDKATGYNENEVRGIWSIVFEK